MLRRLTRRQFGQIAIAGSAAAAIAALANRTFAQPAQAPLVLIAVRPGNLTRNDVTGGTSAAPNDTIVPDDPDQSTAPSKPARARTARGLQLVSLDVGNGQVQTRPTPAASLESGEEISGLAVLTDGSIVVAITPSSTSDQGRNPTRLVLLGTPPRSVNVRLSPQEALDSLLVLNDGLLVSLVVSKAGTPGGRLVTVDPQNGQISTIFELPTDQRFSNLAQCPDGTIYTTTVARDGATSLVQLNLGQNQVIPGAQLRFNNQVWNNGLNSLVCSSAGQLFALGNLWHETTQHLYLIDAKTGNMTRLQPSDAAEITISRT